MDTFLVEVIANISAEVAAHGAVGEHRAVFSRVSAIFAESLSADEEERDGAFGRGGKTIADVHDDSGEVRQICRELVASAILDVQERDSGRQQRNERRMRQALPN